MIDPKIIFHEKWIKKNLSSCPIASGPLEISIDSRTIKAGNLFVALVGPNFNGLNFAQEALDRGACGIIFSQDELSGSKVSSLVKKYCDRYFIEVSNTYEYLKWIAHDHLIEWKKRGGRVIAITGSNGKTTTKEMLSFILRGVMGEELFCTHGNLNNQIGVPLTLFQLRPTHRLAILEMGTNQKGEIKILCDLALPDMGIITNISGTHLEYLESEEGVFQEKRVLFEAVMKNSNNEGVFVINRDDKYLCRLPQNKNVITFGEQQGGQKIQLRSGEVKVAGMQLKNEFLTGKHNFINLACSFLMAKEVLPNRINELAERAEEFRPHSNRSSWIKKGQTNIFLDAYNANPISMKAAISGFLETVKQRKIPLDHVLWIIGDMNELGEQTVGLHRELGAILNEFSAGSVVFVGRYYRHFQQGFADGHERLHHVNEIGDFEQILGKGYLDSFQAVFIKGSRSLQLESLVDIS